MLSAILTDLLVLVSNVQKSYYVCEYVQFIFQKKERGKDDIAGKLIFALRF